MAGRWFSPGTPVSSTNKTDLDDIKVILLNVALNTITLPRSFGFLAAKYFQGIWLFHHGTWSVPDGGYLRNASYVLD